VKFALGKYRDHRGLTRVIAPSDDGELIKMMAERKIEQACLQEAQQCFMQAASTPLLQEPLLSMFGAMGLTCQAFQAVLQGTFKALPSCDAYTRKFLLACKIQREW